ncbi:hypothetical protein ACE8EZ_19680 [Pantoea deleyi]|uniref:hypothetical protein n=1 Tax=Pantoea deleyi TaxID=470932 RepID=UPI0035D516C0
MISASGDDFGQRRCLLRQGDTVSRGGHRQYGFGDITKIVETAGYGPDQRMM